MNLTNLAIRRPITVIMAILIVVLLGGVSLSRLAIDLFPSMNLPVAVVVTSYEGAGPREVEKFISIPIEEALGTVNNINTIRSESQEGLSIVSAVFNWGTDMDFAIMQMRDRVERIEGLLPEDADTPLVLKIDPSMLPVMTLAVSSGQGLEDTRRIVTEILKPRLERLDGVASVEITGGYEREVQVLVDPIKLQSYGITLDDIMRSLRFHNVDLPVGNADLGSKEVVVRMTAEFQSIEEIARLPVPGPNGLIELADVSEVQMAAREASTITRMNGVESIGVSIQKQTDANTVQVARAVSAELKRLREELPDDVEITVALNQAEFIEESIANLIRNGLIGAVLAVGILYVFLGSVSNTAIIALAIPISMIATFILIYFSGLTLNIMSLGGLALGLGMLVDNAIVILENIFRYKESGYKPEEAASKGTAEVANAVTASTLTTIAVFLPVVFIEGVASELFKELALTVSFALFSSLLVSLTVIPMWSAHVGERVPGRALPPAVMNGYLKTLRWALDHRATVITVAVLLLALSIGLYQLVGAEFLPAMDEGEFTVAVRLPNGTSLDRTLEVVEQIERRLWTLPAVEDIFLTAGSSGEFMDVSGGSERGQLVVRLSDDREVSTFAVVEEARRLLEDIPGVDIKVTASSGYLGSEAFSGPPVEVKILGDDIEVLMGLAEQVAQIIKEVPGTREVDTTASEGRPELRVIPRSPLAYTYGLNPAAIGTSLRTSLQGQVATRYRVGGDEFDVRVRLAPAYTDHVDDLPSIPLATATGTFVSVGDVSTLQQGVGPNSIAREGQVRLVSVTADIVERDLASVVSDIKAGVDRLALPAGYEIEYGGQNEEMREAFGNLYLAMALAVILVYMIMAGQFESLLHPLIIMFTLPLAFVGVMAGLVLTGRTLNVISLIGAIMLAGIVVNNAIVLVDYTNTLRRRGKTLREALLEAGPTRLRPILMTALTTILALLPVALGFGPGAEAQAPLATVVVSGLVVATFLTLVVIPVVYLTLEKVASRLFRKEKVDG